MSRPLHLRVVEDAGCDCVTEQAASRSRGATGQPTLFISGNRRALAFLDMDSMTEERLIGIFESSPTAIVDLRDTPRFDLGTLTRRRAFDWFERRKIMYRDVGAFCRGPSNRGSVIDVGALEAALRKGLASEKRITGPLVFFCENRRAAIAVADMVPEILKPPSRKGWELLIG